MAQKSASKTAPGGTKMTSMNLLILAGDGIGPEVMGQVSRIIAWFGGKILTSSIKKPKQKYTTEHT
ncbi:MAG: hypothetical protein AAGE83_07810, partial [Pseudomonadota bacterium]